MSREGCSEQGASPRSRAFGTLHLRRCLKPTITERIEVQEAKPWVLLTNGYRIATRKHSRSREPHQVRNWRPGIYENWLIKGIISVDMKIYKDNVYISKGEVFF